MIFHQSAITFFAVVFASSSPSWWNDGRYAGWHQHLVLAQEEDYGTKGMRSGHPNHGSNGLFGLVAGDSLDPTDPSSDVKGDSNGVGVGVGVGVGTSIKGGRSEGMNDVGRDDHFDLIDPMDPSAVRLGDSDGIGGYDDDGVTSYEAVDGHINLVDPSSFEMIGGMGEGVGSSNNGATRGDGMDIDLVGGVHFVPVDLSSSVAVGDGKILEHSTISSIDDILDPLSIFPDKAMFVEADSDRLLKPTGSAAKYDKKKTTKSDKKTKNHKSKSNWCKENLFVGSWVYPYGCEGQPSEVVIGRKTRVASNEYRQIFTFMQQSVNQDGTYGVCSSSGNFAEDHIVSGISNNQGEVDTCKIKFFFFQNEYDLCDSHDDDDQVLGVQAEIHSNDPKLMMLHFGNYDGTSFVLSKGKTRLASRLDLDERQRKLSGIIPSSSNYENRSEDNTTVDDTTVDKVALYSNHRRHRHLSCAEVDIYNTEAEALDCNAFTSQMGFVTGLVAGIAAIVASGGAATPAVISGWATIANGFTNLLSCEELTFKDYKEFHEAVTLIVKEEYNNVLQHRALNFARRLSSWKGSLPEVPLYIVSQLASDVQHIIDDCTFNPYHNAKLLIASVLQHGQLLMIQILRNENGNDNVCKGLVNTMLDEVAETTTTLRKKYDEIVLKGHKCIHRCRSAFDFCWYTSECTAAQPKFGKLNPPIQQSFSYAIPCNQCNTWSNPRFDIFKANAISSTKDAYNRRVANWWNAVEPHYRELIDMLAKPHQHYMNLCGNGICRPENGDQCACVADGVGMCGKGYRCGVNNICVLSCVGMCAEGYRCDVNNICVPSCHRNVECNRLYCEELCCNGYYYHYRHRHYRCVS